MGGVWKLRPSDLTFLWEGCKRCFYLDVEKDFGRPWSPFPGVFNRMDGLLKEYLAGRDVTEFVSDLPPGEVEVSEEFLKSDLLSPSGVDGSCYFLGKIDAVVDFDNGGYGLIDFKISNPKDESIPWYARQLHAYVHALENPTGGAFSRSPVTHLGLLCLYPEELRIDDGGRHIFDMEPTWIPVERDDEEFGEFLAEVLRVLARDNSPDAAADCEFCEYRGKAQMAGV